MKDLLGATYDDLLRVVRYARRRWRLRVALRGLLFVLGFGFAAFAVSVWGMDHFLYSERAITWFRVLTYAALGALSVRYLILPLTQRVSDQRVALYIEEHEPGLQAALLSALEVGKDQNGAASPELTHRLISDVVEKCRDIEFGQRIEQSRLRRFSAGLAGLAGAGMVAILLSPAFLQHGAMVLFMPWKTFALDNPYQIVVAPGNVEVARGADVPVKASLLGFDHERVELAIKSGEDGDWQRWPMSLSEAALDALEDDVGEPTQEPSSREYEFLLLNMQDVSEYYVEASTVRSALYRIDVLDLPYVERIDLEYHFPSYTGLEIKLEEDSGDIVALRGTDVFVEVVPTMASSDGYLLIDEETKIPLELQESGALRAKISVERPGYYRVELRGPKGEMHRASSEYSIQVLSDLPPILQVRRPGRDIKAHKIDEIFVEVEAEDDYGIGALELVYSVTGADESTETLMRTARPRKEASGSHTFFLEELPLEDGDFISYYARARDASGVGGGQVTTSDIYFVEIRPFGKDYRRQEQGGQGGQGGGGGLDNSLSLTQRQIVSATFNLIRDRSDYAEKEWGENLATLALSQGRLREQVGTLIRRMEARATLLSDDDFQKIISALGSASEAMIPAEEQLLANRPKEALADEQLALKYLQRAEAVFRDVRVSFDPGGGGGGGQAPELSEDLADLFELELDKLKNQYETVQRGERQQTEQEVDEAMQRLRELARRQQQENERMRRQLGSPQAGGGSSRNQQELIEEAEELARKLEKLSREKGRPDLQESARRLRDAADSMRRSSANRSDRSLGEGVAALDELREAKRLLDRSQEKQVGQELEETRERAGRISELQERIEEQLEAMPTEEDAAADAETARRYNEQMDRMLERKDQLGEEIAGLESQLDRLARQSREDQPDAARSLQDAANSIRDNQLKEKVRYSKGVVRGREKEFAQMFEQEIGSDIDELVQRIGEAQEAVGQSPQRQQEDSLERARELVESLESLEERLRERTSAQGQQAQLGDRGDDAEPGERQDSGDQGERELSRLGERPGQQGRQEGQEGQERPVFRPAGARGPTARTTGSARPAGARRPAGQSTGAGRAPQRSDGARGQPRRRAEPGGRSHSGGRRLRRLPGQPGRPQWWDSIPAGHPVGTGDAPGAAGAGRAAPRRAAAARRASSSGSRGE